MKIILFLMSLVVIILLIVLSGCQEEIKAYGDIDQIEITDYSVTTQWYIPGYGTYQNYSKPGFYKHYPETSYNPKYIVIGTAKNIAGRNLDEIEIKISYYDSNSNRLASENTTILNLGYAQSKDFTVNLYLTNENYRNIEKIKFFISV